MTSEWPDRMTTATSAWSTLRELWTTVAAHGTDPPAGDELAAAALFGTELRRKFPDLDVSPTVGGPSWSNEWLDDRYLFGAFGRGDVVPDHPIPAVLFLVDDVLRLGRGRALIGEYAPAAGLDPDYDPAIWARPAARNAPRSDERARLGVISGSDARTPEGTYSVALAALTARRLVDAIRFYANTDPRPPLSEAKRLRQEAAELVTFADDVELLVDTTSRSWLTKANSWIPRVRPNRSAAPARISATLR